jgi:hypothetical protein
LADSRILLGGLEDERVATGNSHRVHPHGNHHREVERCDPGNDTEGLAQAVGIDSVGHLLGVLAFEEVGDVRHELDHFQPALDLTEGVVHRLAVFFTDRPCEIDTMGGDQFAEGEHDVLSAGERTVLPGFEGSSGRSNGGVHDRWVSERHFPGLLAGGRVVDGSCSRAVGGNVLAVDPVGE